MPYIKEDHRTNLDNCINMMVKCLKSNIKNNNDINTIDRGISNEEYLSICGDINYCFSRILGGLIGQVSYSKIVMITGVLENIKQEFYRRIAEPYEDKKILENGDIREYKS